MIEPIKIQPNEPGQTTATEAAVLENEPLTLIQAALYFRNSQIGAGHADDIIEAISNAQTFGTQELSNLATGIGHAPMIGTQHSSIISAIAASPAFAKHVNGLTDLTQAEKILYRLL